MEIINTLLIMDMLLLVTGMMILLVRPFGVDIIWGIMIIAAGFVFSIILLVVKLRKSSVS